MRYWRQILIMIIVLSLAWYISGDNFGGAVDMKIEDEISSLKTSVLTDRQPNGKFKHIPKFSTRNGSYQVDEYELPNGEIGYTITTWKETSDGLYKKVDNYGPLTERASGWIMIESYLPINSATTTK